MPKSNSQQKSTPDARICHQQVGMALLRVRTGPKCPKGNQRKLTWDSNLNCGIARERKKINWPKHTAGHLQNKGTEKFQRRASLQCTGPSPTRGRRQEGGERGKLGPRDITPYQTANRPPVSNQRLPESLAGKVTTRGQLPRTDTRGTHQTGAHGKWGWDHRGIRCTAPRESAPIKLLAAGAALVGKAQNACPS